MVSSFPPMKCGIGVYADQMVKSLVESGHAIDVLSPKEGGGKFKDNLTGDFNVLKLFKYSKGYDKIIFQYHESFFYQGTSGFKNQLSILETHLSFIFLFLILHTRIEVIVHEIPYIHSNRIFYYFERVKWSVCPKIIFHTQKEIDKFESVYFRLDKRKYELSQPNRYFKKFCSETKTESRKNLNLSPHSIIFLCIGFIQPHKGFDRALEAFKNTNRRMELYIVGTIRIGYCEYIDYLHNLQKAAENNPNTFVIDKYLSDEEFDRWINASDVVIIPYREIWSSGVLARAKLFNKSVIACKTGGLVDQISQNDILFQDDTELAKILADFSSAVEK
jgi:glycosyltransferase involved in cell wall biosynthesis